MPLSQPSRTKFPTNQSLNDTLERFPFTTRARLETKLPLTRHSCRCICSRITTSPFRRDWRKFFTPPEWEEPIEATCLSECGRKCKLRMRLKSAAWSSKLSDCPKSKKHLKATWTLHLRRTAMWTSEREKDCRFSTRSLRAKSESKRWSCFWREIPRSKLLECELQDFQVGQVMAIVKFQFSPGSGQQNEILIWLTNLTQISDKFKFNEWT